MRGGSEGLTGASDAREGLERGTAFGSRAPSIWEHLGGPEVEHSLNSYSDKGLPNEFGAMPLTSTMMISGSVEHQELGWKGPASGWKGLQGELVLHSLDLVRLKVDVAQLLPLEERPVQRLVTCTYMAAPFRRVAESSSIQIQSIVFSQKKTRSDVEGLTLSILFHRLSI